MKARLISLDASKREEYAFLRSFPVTIGRSCEADIQLADRWVSRLHCEIDQIDGTLVVRDLHSRHGTYVNGRRIAEILLMPGNRLGIGMTKFLVSYERNPANSLIFDTPFCLQQRKPQDVQAESTSQCTE
jgi:pSer/pThr/pTyr-binding forkhead associated (FHA) protein